MSERRISEPYEVTTAQNAAESASAEQNVQPEGEEEPDSLLPGEIIDLNQADVYELQRLPGIGEKRAQAIVEYREEHGPFQSVEDITQVSGIGEAILSGFQEYVTVEAEGTT